MNYWNNISAMYEKQRAKGLKEYGMTLEENNSLSIIERLSYLQEELVDALVYTEHIKTLFNNAIVHNPIYEVDYPTGNIVKFIVQDISSSGIKYCDDWVSLTELGKTLFLDSALAEEALNNYNNDMEELISNF